MNDTQLRALGLRKRFGDPKSGVAPALDDLSFTLEAGRHVCVMGPSGSGKTTLLRILAGLEPADAGELWLGETRIDELPAAARPTRTVFQTPALFPHLSVLANLTLVDRMRRVARSEQPPSRSPRALLAALGLDPALFAERRVDALSGGERQRVALARAIYRAPPWLLLDEPLAALDPARRAALRRALASLQREDKLGMVHVTHDPRDALALADQLLCIVEGKLAAAGEPHRLYLRPPSLTVARLLGELSRLPDPGRELWIRPERLELVEASAGRVEAELLERRCLGPLWEHTLRVTSLDLSLVVMAARAWEGPRNCGLRWHDEDILEFLT